MKIIDKSQSNDSLVSRAQYLDEHPNGGDNPDTPDIMKGGSRMEQLLTGVRNDIAISKNKGDLTRYQVTEGMQNEEKLPFFTEFIDDDDVQRMNTIEAFITFAPLIIRKTSEKNRTRINLLLNNTYGQHVKTHKRNMTSKGRAREDAYIKILSGDFNVTEKPARGFEKFFGVKKPK